MHAPVGQGQYPWFSAQLDSCSHTNRKSAEGGRITSYNVCYTKLLRLRVATRIEAARTHGHGALVLGQELQGLSQTMQEKIDFIAERCEVLATLLQRALLVEQQAQEGSLAAARTEIGQARELLVGIASRCGRASDQTVLLQRHSTELSTSFGELVAALQFQDITRQRLQHIAQTLQELSVRVRNNFV